MWGLVEICYANEEEHRKWLEKQEAEQIQIITYREQHIPASEPLEILAARLRKASPLALDLLVEMFRPPEGQKDFIMLVREYLPDMEQRILEIQDSHDRIDAFGQAFSSRYFPLYEAYYDDEESYSSFTERCPAESFACSEYSYDEIAESGDAVSIIIAAILENPWYGDRASFVEAALQFLPKNLLETIPDDGFPILELEELLTSTKFEPIIFWAKTNILETGNYFFDAGDIETTGAQFLVSWDRPTIEELTRQWQAFESWTNKWDKFKQWFTKDLANNAYNLIKILKERSSANGGEALSDQEAYAGPDPNQGKLFDLEPY